MQNQILEFKDNPELDLAYNFIEYTNKNIFLTGRAGTGKTTFLHNFKSISSKKIVVLAPTGVAAVNAGAVTLHSFFQLPFGPYLPDSVRSYADKEQQRKVKFNKTKINIIKSMDLLIIDEISMVRADILDAIDETLRQFRDEDKAFGGLQLLMIGDLHQLSPVTKPEDWNILRNCYKSPFFFESKALKKTDYLTIELKKIYRQTDENFINLLDKLRDSFVTLDTLSEINKRYIPDFQQDYKNKDKNKNGYINLTSHNSIAKKINDNKLESISSQEYVYTATVEGDFPEQSYPADAILRLKKGAQVMFIKNDLSYEKRFFNGKIGVVTNLTKDSIEVTPFGEGARPIILEPREWINRKYTINNKTNEIVETTIGKFIQYPVKLAWAITIHKSQGLTFERAIIDASDSFTHGQIYVALSRCRSLENIILTSKIRPGAIISDVNIKNFYKSIEQNTGDKNKLLAYKKYYYLELFLEQFDFLLIKKYLNKINEFIFDELAMFYPELLDKWTDSYLPIEAEIFVKSENIRKQLTEIFDTHYAALINNINNTDVYTNNNIININNINISNNKILQEVTSKFCEYFIEKYVFLYDLLVQINNITIKNKEIKKQFKILLEQALKEIYIKHATLLDTKENGFIVSNYLKNKSTYINKSNNLINTNLKI